MARAIHPVDKMSERAAKQMAGFHTGIVDEVAKAVGKEPVVVVGMAQNPFVKRARKGLDAAGVKYTYLEYGSYFSKWKERLAITLWSGWPTFPQVFVNGKLMGGCTDIEAAISDGSLKKEMR